MWLHVLEREGLGGCGCNVGFWGSIGGRVLVEVGVWSVRSRWVMVSWRLAIALVRLTREWCTGTYVS